MMQESFRRSWIGVGAGRVHFGVTASRLENGQMRESVSPCQPPKVC